MLPSNSFEMKLKYPPVFTSGKPAPENPANLLQRSKVILDFAVLLLMVSLSALNTMHANAIVYSATRGNYVVKLPGTDDPANPVRTYLGIQLLPDTRFIGDVGSVSGNTLSLENVYDHTNFSTPERESYVHVMTGSGRGFVADITEFRTSEIVCSKELTPWMAPFTKIRIRPHSHISDLLGADNRFGLGAGPDATTADNVVVWDPDAQVERVYYFNSTRMRWEELGIEADASHAIFRFPYGFYIVRRSPGTIRIVLSGEIGGDAILLPVRSGANVFSLPVNLSASLDNLLPSEGDFAVISGPNAKRSDILTFEEPTTGLHRGPFYHLSGPNGSGWREIGVNNSDAPVAPLDLLSTLVLRREGNASHILVEGSLDPPTVPRPPLPPSPEPGEIQLKGHFSVPPPILNSDVVISIESSIDLETWVQLTPDKIFRDENGICTFDLPSGQGRAFYRITLTPDF